MALYPLRFTPKFVEKIWGGRKLETVLGKTLPAGVNVGESWELFDFPPGVVDRSGDWSSAVVENGPLAGRSLHYLMTHHNRELMGSVAPARDGQFPLLIKFLDAREDLSVQVHPDQKYADENPEAHLKSEAWYVFQHEPGARLLKGLTAGVGREQLADAIKGGTVQQCIQSVPVKQGDCYYLPSGTVHALGAGILAAEVQTPSDTTFRVYDFDRIEQATGKPRQLHVEQALACIDFAPPRPPTPRTHVADHHSTVTRLVDSEYFRIEKVRLNQGSKKPIPYSEPVVWMMLDGSVTITVDTVGPTTVRRGQTVLLPAVMGNAVMSADTDAVWLEVTFPGILMGANTRTVVWQGWRLQMPRRWDAVKLEGDHRQGYALFADAARPRLGLRWQTPGRRFDPKKATTAAMREEVGRLAADEATAMTSDDWESPLLYVEPDPPGRDVWSAYSPTSDRLIQVAYHAHRREHLLRTHVLPTLRDLPVDQACPWSVFDLSLLVPGDMALSSQRLNSGDLGLSFEDRRTALSVRQIAVASLALRRKSLDEWVGDHQTPLRGMYRARPTSPTTLNVGGRTCDARIGRMTRRRRYFLMAGRPQSLTTIVAHDADRDRLVILHGAQEGLLRAVSETVGLA